MRDFTDRHIIELIKKHAGQGGDAMEDAKRMFDSGLLKLGIDTPITGYLPFVPVNPGSEYGSLIGVSTSKAGTDTLELAFQVSSTFAKAKPGIAGYILAPPLEVGVAMTLVRAFTGEPYGVVNDGGKFLMKWSDFKQTSTGNIKISVGAQTNVQVGYASNSGDKPTSTTIMRGWPVTITAPSGADLEVVRGTVKGTWSGGE